MFDATGRHGVLFDECNCNDDDRDDKLYMGVSTVNVAIANEGLVCCILSL